MPEFSQFSNEVRFLNLYKLFTYGFDNTVIGAQIKRLGMRIYQQRIVRGVLMFAKVSSDLVSVDCITIFDLAVVSWLVLRKTS
jgi:hypothetical protein